MCIHDDMLRMHVTVGHVMHVCMKASCACMMAYRACILNDGKLCMHDGKLCMHDGKLCMHDGKLCMHDGMFDPKNAIDMLEMLCTVNLTQLTPNKCGACSGSPQSYVYLFWYG